jgi:hypothetical protein
VVVTRAYCIEPPLSDAVRPPPGLSAGDQSHVHRHLLLLGHWRRRYVLLCISSVCA